MAAVNQSQFNKSRLDKFLLVLNLPETLKNISKESLEERDNDVIIKNTLQFSVYGSIVPKIEVPHETLGYAGQSFKVSKHTRPPYENVSVNFTVDNQFNNYWILYKWLDLLNDDKLSKFNGKDLVTNPQFDAVLQNNPKSFAPPTLYQSDFSIYSKDEFDKNTVKFTYKNAFPVSIGGINYNYREPGEIETTFEFAFSQLLVELV